ncbi:MAG: hypothetical protein WBG37_08275 [Desulfobacterales bacterium]
MGFCINHPDRETCYLCMKHDIYLCEECLSCRDPQIYCKFRPSCPIWFLTKRKAGLDREEEDEAVDVQSAVEVNFASSNPGYMDQFTSALFLPHTDLKALPSVVLAN